ncbi:unnamed protein product [Ectocarpus sp. 12 AP-2014]
MRTTTPFLLLVGATAALAGATLAKLSDQCGPGREHARADMFATASDRGRGTEIFLLYFPPWVHPCNAHKPVSTFQAHAPSLFFHLAIASCRFVTLPTPRVIYHPSSNQTVLPRRHRFCCQAAARGTNRPVYCESRYYQAMAGGGLCDK